MKGMNEGAIPQGERGGPITRCNSSQHPTGRNTDRWELQWDLPALLATRNPQHRQVKRLSVSDHKKRGGVVQRTRGGRSGAAVRRVYFIPKEIPNRLTGTRSAPLGLNAFPAPGGPGILARTITKAGVNMSRNAPRRAPAEASVHAAGRWMALTFRSAADALPAPPPSDEITNG